MLGELIYALATYSICCITHKSFNMFFYKLNSCIYSIEPIDVVFVIALVYTATFRAMGHFLQWCCCPLYDSACVWKLAYTTITMVSKSRDFN
jgi:hypothetical protein